MQPKKSFGEIKAIIDQIKFTDRNFRLLEKGDGFLLQLEYLEPDVDHPENPEPVLQRARKWYISAYSTETEIVETAFKAVKTSMLHIAQEHFLYKGHRVYSPHIDINARIEICERELFDGRD